MFVERFKKGKWFDKSNSLLADKSKVLSVLTVLGRYMKKGGLKEIREQLRLLRDYISDIIKGIYKDYSASSLTLAVAAILYVVSPFDFLPDLIPFGFIDDIAIVTWAIAKMDEELNKYQARKNTITTNPSGNKSQDIDFEEIK